MCTLLPPSTPRTPRIWGSSFQLPWFLLASRTGRGLTLPQSLPGPAPVSVFVAVSAVRVAVGEAGVAGPQGFQDLCQLRDGLVDTAVIAEAAGAALQESVDLLLHRRLEFPRQELWQKLLTHHDKAVLLPDGVTGHKWRLAVHSQAAEYIFILLLAIDQLAPCWGQVNPLETW